MTTPLAIFQTQPTHLTSKSNQIALIQNHKIHTIYPTSSFTDTPPLDPICLDFITSQVLSYGTKTGGIGIFDYRNAIHNIFTPANLRYQTYLLKNSGHFIWAACDSSANSINLFDLRNMQKPVFTSGVMTGRIVDIFVKRNGKIMAVGQNGEYCEFNSMGELLERKMCISDKSMISVGYSQRNDYYVSLFKDSVVVHDRESLYDEVVYDNVYEKVVVLNDNRTLFISSEAIAVCDDKCDEIYSIEAKNAVVSEFQNGFLYCSNGNLLYQPMKTE